MIKVVGGILTGEQQSIINGQLVTWDKVKLSVVTDEVPEAARVQGYFGLYCDEYSFSRKDVELIGFTHWHELVGRYINLGYGIFGGKPRVTSVTLLDTVPEYDVLAPVIDSAVSVRFENIPSPEKKK